MIFIYKLINRVCVRPLLRVRMRRVGSNFRFGYSSNFESPSSFSIGNNFFSGPYTYFSSNADTPVSIGDNVMFGPGCKLIGGNHNIGWTGGVMMNAPYLGGGKGVVIEDDVWVGANSIVLDGAVLSEGSVIAAGSVVTGDVKPYSVYGGVPARFIKYRFSKNEIYKINSRKYNADQLCKFCSE